MKCRLSASQHSHGLFTLRHVTQRDPLLDHFPSHDPLRDRKCKVSYWKFISMGMIHKVGRVSPGCCTCQIACERFQVKNDLIRSEI